MPAFLVDAASVRDGGVVLGAEEAHHVRVRRHRPGDEVDVIDGEGKGYRIRIQAIEDERVTGRIVERRSDLGESPVRLHLAAAIVKGLRFDLVVEKATEVGVASITPVTARRSVARPGGRGDRWRRLARSAAKQCGRSRVPPVSEPVPLLDAAGAMAADGARLLVADPAAPGDLRSVCDPGVRSAALFVGPEGGFAPEELHALGSLGARVFAWGNRRLRAETAAVVLSAMVITVMEWQCEETAASSF
ncbi:MAG: RsmE family RNA methyltransferase [Gemmatimonadaceae bacterium]|nr:RsmE family RNA methyltransferase [Gemmatimonadaceae bacterium]